MSSAARMSTVATEGSRLSYRGDDTFYAYPDTYVLTRPLPKYAWN